MATAARGVSPVLNGHCLMLKSLDAATEVDRVLRDAAGFGLSLQTRMSVHFLGPKQQWDHMVNTAKPFNGTFTSTVHHGAPADISRRPLQLGAVYISRSHPQPRRGGILHGGFRRCQQLSAPTASAGSSLVRRVRITEDRQVCLMDARLNDRDVAEALPQAGAGE